MALLFPLPPRLRCFNDLDLPRTLHPALILYTNALASPSSSHSSSSSPTPHLQSPGSSTLSSVLPRHVFKLRRDPAIYNRSLKPHRCLWCHLMGSHLASATTIIYPSLQRHNDLNINHHCNAPTHMRQRRRPASPLLASFCLAIHNDVLAAPTHAMIALPLHCFITPPVQQQDVCGRAELGDYRWCVQLLVLDFPSS